MNIVAAPTMETRMSLIIGMIIQWHHLPRRLKSIMTCMGSECNFGNVKAALKAAHDGDKIYIPPGTYSFNNDDYVHIIKSIEIIGMEKKPQDTVIYFSERIDITVKGTVRIINLTLRHGTRYDKWQMSKSKD
jgi:pectin methylesterase-like acyl-CoA thioesterase